MRIHLLRLRALRRLIPLWLTPLVIAAAAQATEPAPPPVAARGPAVYDPSIDPADFSPNVTNPYLTLTPRTRMVYEGKSEEGTERIETYVTDRTRRVMGVDTRVVRDRVFLDDELIEDTEDYFAQDREGNVWYFGEASREMLGGKKVNQAGSWQAGVDGAKPGIVMSAKPAVGQTVQQEYARGVAEDRADVLALSESVSVPYGELGGCLKTLAYTPLEPDVKEYKYYCPQVGGVAFEVDLDGGEDVRLLRIERDVDLAAAPFEQEPQPLAPKISKERAAEIALGAVPGEVTDIAIEKKFGHPAYVVEIDAGDGGETDVIIDIETGRILGTES